MHAVQGNLHVSPDSPLGRVGGDAAGPTGDAADADAYFRRDAERLGYLNGDPRGMAKYYRDHGILPPRYLDESVPEHEVTGLDLDRELP